MGKEDQERQRCVECGHEHRRKDIIDVQGGGEEMMCIWCVKSDYANDPLNDPNKGFGIDQRRTNA
jgi:hypothetical protein